MQRTVINNRYKVSEPLGGGGMAQVYLAHDEVLDRDVALKMLRDQYAGDEEFVERFRQEARSAARLSHPHIVQVYDQGRSEDGAYYIAMEYVPGGTLKERIVRKGALSPDAAAGVALQVADALEAAHEHGVIHRDIKPHNILVTRAGDIKVTDFGIARAASAARSITRTGVVLGTTGYMSPEQVRGEPAGPASDLYSLGVVLYEMLTGSLPYEAENTIAQTMKHVNEPVPSPRESNPEVSEGLDDITTKLLAKDPEDRYASAAALGRDLERVISGLSLEGAGRGGKTKTATAPLPPGARTRRTAVQPPAAAPFSTSERRSRRRNWLLPLLAAALLALAMLGGLAYERGVFDGFDPTGSNNSSQSGPGGGQPGNQIGAPQQNGIPGAQQPSTAQVPDLSYVPEAKAAYVLADAGLKLGNRYETPSDTIPAGSVVRTDPAVGASAQQGGAVDIYVSTGPSRQSAPAQPPQQPARRQ